MSEGKFIVSGSILTSNAFFPKELLICSCFFFLFQKGTNEFKMPSKKSILLFRVDSPDTPDVASHSGRGWCFLTCNVLFFFFLSFALRIG